MYNRALTNYDPGISGYDSHQYTKEPYQYTAPDITYTQQQYQHLGDGSFTHRVKGHAPQHGEILPAANSFQMPLPDAVYHMEEGTAVVLDMAILPPNVSVTKADIDTAIILATPTANKYFNIVTIISFVFNIVIFITSGCLFKEKEWFYRSVVGIFQSLFKD